MSSEFLSAVISLFFASASLLSFYSFNGLRLAIGFYRFHVFHAHRGRGGMNPSSKKHLSRSFFLGVAQSEQPSAPPSPPKWFRDSAASLNGRNGRSGATLVGKSPLKQEGSWIHSNSTLFACSPSAFSGFPPNKNTHIRLIGYSKLAPGVCVTCLGLERFLSPSANWEGSPPHPPSSKFMASNNDLKRKC